MWYKIKRKQTHLFLLRWKKKLIVSVSDNLLPATKHWWTFSSWDMKNLLQATPQTHHLSQPPSQTFSDVHEHEPLISGMLVLQVDSLCHLPGAVQRHSHSHGGHHHGDRVDETALWLHLHLTWDLPLHEMHRDDVVWWDQSHRLNLCDSFYHFDYDCDYGTRWGDTLYSTTLEQQNRCSEGFCSVSYLS